MSSKSLSFSLKFFWLPDRTGYFGEVNKKDILKNLAVHIGKMRKLMKKKKDLGAESCGLS